MSRSIKRVLITGADGFIGSHLTRRLLQEGLVVGIIEHQDCAFCRIEDVLDKIENHICDLRETSRVHKIIQDFRPDIIFHLAAYYTVEHRSSEVHTLVETNVLGTLNLLEAAKVCGIDYLVNTSSSFVYGQKTHPTKEYESLDPLNLYALTKLQAEQACSFYARKYGLKAVTCRLFPPYGPEDNERKLIPHSIRSFLLGEPLKLTTGKQKWDYIHVSDIIEAYVKLLDVSHFKDEHEIFNIGTGKAFSIREVIEKIQQIMNVDEVPDWGAYPHRENEVMFLCGDIKKARNNLMWQPRITLEEGLESTVEWFIEYFSKQRSKDGKEN